MKPVIRTPYFEVGTKNYVYGDKLLEYAKAADAAAEKYDIDVLFICPALEVRRVAENTKHLFVLATYMDTLRPGRGCADILPEGLKAAGAVGVMINHCEKPMSLPQMKKTIDRARELDFLVFACADTLDEAKAIAQLHPDIINPEPSEIIGGGKGSSPMAYVRDSIQVIKEIDPNSIPLGYDSESNWFITMCEQYGSDYTSASGDHYLFNNETNRGFIKMFREWYQKGYLTTQKLYGAYTSGLFTSTDEVKSYMSIGSSAGATHQRPAADANGNYPFEVGISTIPQLGNGNNKVISQGPSVCIFKKDNPQEVIASWLFVKFLTTSVDFQAEFSMASGYVPVLKSVADNEAYASFIAQADGGKYISALSAKVCLEQEDYYYTSPAFNGSSTARDQVGTLLTKCLTADDGGNVDAMIEAAFAEAVDECEYNG